MNNCGICGAKEEVDGMIVHTSPCAFTRTSVRIEILNQNNINNTSILKLNEPIPVIVSLREREWINSLRIDHQ